MECFICFAIDVFIGILLALIEQARINTEHGQIECDKAVVYGDEEDDDEDYDDYEDGEQCMRSSGADETSWSRRKARERRCARREALK